MMDVNENKINHVQIKIIALGWLLYGNIPIHLKIKYDYRNWMMNALFALFAGKDSNNNCSSFMSWAFS